MKISGILIALVAVLLVIVVYYVAASANRTKHSKKIVADGDSLTIECPQGLITRILVATYGGKGCSSVDVTDFMQSWVTANPGKPFRVDPTAFGDTEMPECSAPRELSVEYICKSPKENIIPRRVDTCSSAQDVLPAAMADPDYLLHQWTGQDNRNWTVEVTPWDPDSKIQLTAAALTAGARPMHRPINPLTRIGITDRVLNWDNPYANTRGVEDISASPCSSAVSVYDVQPFQPGFLIPKANDSTDGTMAQRRYYYQPAYWSRASGPYGGPYRPVASCTNGKKAPSIDEIDSNLAFTGGNQSTKKAVGSELKSRMQNHPGYDEFWWQTTGGRRKPWYQNRNERDLAELVGVQTGPYAPPQRSQASFVFPKETLRSRGNYREVAKKDQCMTGIGCGLGSTWIDPRFAPGPQEMYLGGDSIWAHGGHAGGPTFGSFTPYVFQTSGTWNRYPRGFGDGHYVAPTRKTPRPVRSNFRPRM
jgi:hypothetical protein